MAVYQSKMRHSTITARKSHFQPNRFITAHRPRLEGGQLTS